MFVLEKDGVAATDFTGHQACGGVSELKFLPIVFHWALRVCKQLHGSGGIILHEVSIAGVGVLLWFMPVVTRWGGGNAHMHKEERGILTPVLRGAM